MKKFNIKKSEYKYISKNDFDYFLRKTSYKTERGLRNFLTKENKKMAEKVTAEEVKELTVTIEWKKTRRYGYCPTAAVKVCYVDGFYEIFKNVATAGGCGYCKESAVIADCCSKFLYNKLYKKRNSKKQVPYGLTIKKGSNPSFQRGVGVSCFYSIAGFLNGKFEKKAGGELFDVYSFNFK